MGAARVYTLPSPSSRGKLAGLPGEAELRARAAAGLRSQREAAGYSVEGWADLLTTVLGRPVTPGKLRGWESPTGPSPSNHVSLLAYMMAARLVGTCAYNAGLRLVFGP